MNRKIGDKESINKLDGSFELVEVEYDLDGSFELVEA